MNMKYKQLLSITVSSIMIIGCNDKDSSKAFEKKGVVLELNANSTIKLVQYTNPNNSSQFIISCDSLGNPINILTKAEQDKIESVIELESGATINNIQFYAENNKSKKRYSFAKHKLEQIDELMKGENSSFVLNQWRYLDSDERVIEDEGLFIDVQIKDTITQGESSFAEIQLKGGKALRGVRCVINNDTITSTNRKFKIPLSSGTLGYNELVGYISNYDTTIMDGEEVIQEFKIKFDRKYYVQSK